MLPKCGDGGDDIAHQYRPSIRNPTRIKATGILRMDGFDAINTGTTGLGPPAGLYPYGFVKRTEVKPYWDMAIAVHARRPHVLDRKERQFPART